jgi:hypothetical protein
MIESLDAAEALDEVDGLERGVVFDLDSQTG